MANFIDFHIIDWKVGSINSTAGLFAGENLQYKWHLSSKVNVANRGTMGDYNVLSSPVNQVYDPDVLDTWVQKAPPYLSLKPPSPAWIRVLDSRRRAYKKSGRNNIPLDFDW